MKIKPIQFPESQYFKEAYPKKQIYLHHTAGNGNAEQVFMGWASNPDHIGTCVAISRDGQIVQGFASEYWAYHLGVKRAVVPLDKISIGIEVCNWGQLTNKEGKFYNYVNREVPKEEVYELETPFKGFKYFQGYTDAQIQSVKELLLHFNNKYGIPLDYNEDIWDVNTRALKGTAGLYTHNSVRLDKVDIYPHHKMIEMLKSL